MASFNILFALILSILIFLLFKYLLFSQEEEASKEFGSWLGALVGLYFLGSLANSKLILSFTTLGILALIGIAVWRLLNGTEDEATFNKYNFRKEFHNFDQHSEAKQRQTLAHARRRVRTDSHALLQRLNQELHEIRPEIEEETRQLNQLLHELEPENANLEGATGDARQKTRVQQELRQLTSEIESFAEAYRDLLEQTNTVADFEHNISEARQRVEDLANDATHNVPEISRAGTELQRYCNSCVESLNKLDTNLREINRRLRHARIDQRRTALRGAIAALTGA